MSSPTREKARQLAREHLERGDALGGFEVLDAAAGGDAGITPWADLAPNPNRVNGWLCESARICDGKDYRFLGERSMTREALCDAARRRVQERLAKGGTPWAK
jgi:hypothetical protein